VRELAYSGRRLPAEKAKAIGLVNETFATQDAMISYVLELAHEIAEKAPVAVAGSKRMINHARDRPIADGLDYGDLAGRHVFAAHMRVRLRLRQKRA
jgi:enoyl-CoA hydratase